MNSLLRTLTLTSLLVLLSVPLAAQMPPDELFRDFEPTGSFAFELGGETLGNAEIFLSERAPAYLILAPELASPVMILPRARTVESVDLMKVDRQDDGTIDLLADATLAPLGSFEVSQATQEVLFEIDGTPAKLKPKPPLTGMHSAASLEEHNPAYAYKAKAYEPARARLETLRSENRNVRVRVYFGSWCPVCSRLVPNVMRVAEELEGSKVDFEYYGLPQPMTDDPITEKEDIHGVPTAVVYVDGQEKARLSGKDLSAPEQALVDVLGG